MFLVLSWLLWKHTDNMDPVDITSKVVIPKALLKLSPRIQGGDGRK
jgi:hypothetical protein